MSDYDLIVVGAGPAGSMAARVAAQYGLSVLVLEKKKVVGYPSHCAGGILTPILDNLGLKSIVNKSIRAQIRKFRFISPHGITFEHDFRRPMGYIIDRPTFDQLLIQNAQLYGTELLTQTRAVGLERGENSYTHVKVEQEGKVTNISTKLIIGADGISSNIARWTGITVPHKYIGIGYGYNAEHLKNISPDTAEIYFLSALPGGYAWIFPRGTNSANIGVGGYNTGTYMQKIFDWFKRSHKIASLKLKNVQLGDYTGGMVPGSKLPRKTTFNFGMLVGDAANQVDTLTGEGIRLSLLCGKLAGQIAVVAIKQNNLSLVHQYHHLMQKRSFLELFTGNLIRHFLLRAKPDDYDRFVRAISHMDLNLVFRKKAWIPLFLRTFIRYPSVLKILSRIFHNPPSHVKEYPKSSEAP